MQKCDGCRNGKEWDFDLKIACQPIVDISTGKPFAYESLVRGPDGEGAEWVLSQVTEENRYRFDQACRVAAIRQAVAAGLLEDDARLSINFLPNAVYSPMACIQLTLATARETGMPSDRLIFEFTENEKPAPEHVRDIVEAYRSLGFSTAIDDFGAGHAGLGLLANLPTDLIKLDMDLIRGIDTNVPRRQIVQAMVRLCEDMGLMIIAEGIETEGELAALADMGIRLVQGFLLGRPAIGSLQSPVLEERLLRAA